MYVLLNVIQAGAPKAAVKIIVQVCILVVDVGMFLGIFLKYGVVQKLMDCQWVVGRSKWVDANMKFVFGKFPAHRFGKAGAHGEDSFF